MKETITNILKYLLVQRGLDFTGNRASMVERRITTRLLKTNTKSIDMYFEYLKKEPAELQKLISCLTINVSSFFRDPLMWENFYKIILPSLLDKLDANGSVRIWSAGCASGEEPYTIALLLNEFCEREKRNYRSHIFASDLDQEIISQAKKAAFKFESITNVKFGLISKYFKISKNDYNLSPKIKAMVEFSVFDLLNRNQFAPSGSIYANFDIIFCRNVLIYFNIAYQNIIFEKIYRSLKDGGLLILGEAETISSKYKNKFIRYNEYYKIYRKK